MRQRRGKEGLAVSLVVMRPSSSLLLLTLEEGRGNLARSLRGKELEGLLGRVYELLHESQLVAKAEEAPRRGGRLMAGVARGRRKNDSRLASSAALLLMAGVVVLSHWWRHACCT